MVRQNLTSKCPVAGCTKERRKRTDRPDRHKYCSTHSSRLQQFGGFERLGRKAYWYTKKYNLCRPVEGYPCITFFGKIVLVHRLMDALTNGPIPKGWDVHHKDEDRTNFHWDNLERIPHEEHTRLHSEGRYGTAKFDK